MDKKPAATMDKKTFILACCATSLAVFFVLEMLHPMGVKANHHIDFSKKKICGEGKDEACQSSPAVVNMLFLVDAMETFAFGTGLVFSISILPVIQRVAPELQRQTKTSFFVITWNLLTWLPHSRGHSSLPRNTPNLLILTLLFHWPVVVGSLYIARFQDRLLTTRLSMLTQRGRVHKENKVLGYFFAAVVFAFEMWIMSPYGPLAPLKPRNSSFIHRFFIVTGYVEAIGGCLAAVYLVKQFPRLQAIKQFFGKSGGDAFSADAGFQYTTIALCVNLTLPFYHNRAHLAIPGTPLNWLAMEAFFHFSLEIAAAVLAYYQFQIIKIADQYSNSEIRKSQNAKKLDSEASTVASESSASSASSSSSSSSSSSQSSIASQVVPVDD